VSNAKELDPIKARLAEIKARQDALAAKREERLSKLAESEAVEAAALELADNEAIEAAEAAHGPAYDGNETDSKRQIALVRTSLGVVIVKRALPVVFKRYRESKMTDADTEALVKACLVHPDRQRLNAMVDEQPFILERSANAIGILAGVRVKELAGK